MNWIKKTYLQCIPLRFGVCLSFYCFFGFRNHCYSFHRTNWRLVTSICRGPGPVALHRTCYTIVCIVPWCPAVNETSTASIQSIGFTVTGILFCLSELLISFACDLWVWNVRFTETWDFWGVNVWSRDFFGFCWKPQGFFWVLTFGSIRSSPSLEIPSTPPARGRSTEWTFSLIPGLRNISPSLAFTNMSLADGRG